jgi:PadR family transcriptional regulator PadR
MIQIVAREILLSFWKVHILHHASESPVYGQWMARELRRHGYAISPGTLYPLLNRMERHGWLVCVGAADRRLHARKEYRITREGRKVLALVRSQVEELHREVVVEAQKPCRR